MRNILNKYISNWSLLLMLTILSVSCQQETMEADYGIATGGGTLTTYKAYTIDSVPGTGAQVYGRAVFWEDYLGRTLLQVSVYNVGEDDLMPSAIFSGSMPGSTTLISLYNISNTGEGYDFGEFASSKYYVISEEGFYENLDAYNASIQIMKSTSDDTVIAGGDIGMNAEPVESNE